MKIVINTAFGATSQDTINKRQNPELIAAVESGRFVGHVDERFGFAEVLRVVNIPDDATDYQILNYDGSEIIVYVRNNKLYFAPTDTDASRILQY